MPHPTLPSTALDDRYVIEREISRAVADWDDYRADAWMSRVIRP